MNVERCKTSDNVQVITKSGNKLGKLVWVEVNRETGKTQAFGVAAKGVLPRLLDEVLMVGWGQVIEWTDKALIVDDAVIKAMETMLASNAGQMAESGASFKDLEV